jgi:hypothetical protein
LGVAVIGLPGCELQEDRAAEFGIAPFEWMVHCIIDGNRVADGFGHFPGETDDYASTYEAAQGGKASRSWA